jgi:hypothetical protein
MPPNSSGSPDRRWRSSRWACHTKAHTPVPLRYRDARTVEAFVGMSWGPASSTAEHLNGQAGSRKICAQESRARCSDVVTSQSKSSPASDPAGPSGAASARRRCPLVEPARCYLPGRPSASTRAHAPRSLPTVSQPFKSSGALVLIDSRTATTARVRSSGAGLADITPLLPQWSHFSACRGRRFARAIVYSSTYNSWRSRNTTLGGGPRLPVGCGGP